MDSVGTWELFVFLYFHFVMVVLKTMLYIYLFHLRCYLQENNPENIGFTLPYPILNNDISLTSPHFIKSAGFSNIACKVLYATNTSHHKHSSNSRILFKLVHSFFLTSF